MERQDHEITDPDIIRLCASPVRSEILGMLNQGGRATVREIGERLGYAPSALYRHLDMLCSAGLLTVKTDLGTAQDARVYEGPAGSLSFVLEPDKPDSVAAVCDVMRTCLRRASREITSSVEGDRGNREGPARDTLLRDAFGWVSEDDLEAINTHIHAIADLLERTERREDSKLVAFTCALRLRDDRGTKA